MQYIRFALFFITIIGIDILAYPSELSAGEKVGQLRDIGAHLKDIGIALKQSNSVVVKQLVEQAKKTLIEARLITLSAGLAYLAQEVRLIKEEEETTDYLRRVSAIEALGPALERIGDALLKQEYS